MESVGSLPRCPDWLDHARSSSPEHLLLFRRCPRVSKSTLIANWRGLPFIALLVRFNPLMVNLFQTERVSRGKNVTKSARKVIQPLLKLIGWVLDIDR